MYNIKVSLKNNRKLKNGFTPTPKNFGVSSQSERGFTLIEMLVATSVLSVTVLISLSSFLAVLAAQKKANAVANVQENIKFSVEMILREIRTGKNYYCGYGTGSDTNDCPNGGTVITFRNYLGQTIIYRLNGSQIEKSDDGGFNYLAVTFPEIKITDLKFYVLGSDPPPDTSQPRVIITIAGEAGITAKAKSHFNIQTTVSQRILDL